MAEPQQASGPAEGWTWAAPSNTSASSNPRAPRPFIATSHEEEPSALGQMLGPLAHPETLTDFARILTLPVDTVRKALATAVAARVGPGVASQALSATGRGAETLADSRLGRLAEAGGVADAVYRLDPKGAVIAAAPTALRLVGRGMQRAGAALSESTPVVEEVAAVKPPPETPLALSRRVKAEYRAARGIPMDAQHPGTAPPATAVPEAAVPTTATAKPFLRAAEAGEYKRLLKLGKTHQEAMDLIQAQRDFAAKFGTPTSEQVRGSVQTRNDAGRWPE